MVLRSLYLTGSNAGGRPPVLPRLRRFFFWSFLDRDDRLDAALAQVRTVGGRRAGLVAHRGAGPDAGASLAAAGDAQLVQQRDELRAVPVLAGAGELGERAAAPVSEQVNLGAQPAP